MAYPPPRCTLLFSNSVSKARFLKASPSAPPVSKLCWLLSLESVPGVAVDFEHTRFESEAPENREKLLLRRGRKLRNMMVSRRNRFIAQLVRQKRDVNVLEKF